jgi:hypothetical protein
MKGDGPWHITGSVHRGGRGDRNFWLAHDLDIDGGEELLEPNHDKSSTMIRRLCVHTIDLADIVARLANRSHLDPPNVWSKEDAELQNKNL